MLLCPGVFILSSLSDCYNAIVTACESPLVTYNMGNEYYPSYYEQKPGRGTIATYYNPTTNSWTQPACCDCSSLMGFGLWRGGYTSSYYACTTTTMYDGFLRQCGWQKITDNPYSSGVVWQAGDILLNRDAHTLMVYEGNGGAAGRCMGAHGRGGQYSPEDNPGANRANLLARQVSIQDGLCTYNTFTQLWRDPNGGTITPTIQAQWHQINNTSQKYYLLPGGNTGNDAANAGFPTQEQLENMIMVYSYLQNNTNASKACIAGILGNMIYESTLNPNCWQLTPGVNYGGYGLVQFDPPDKYLWNSWQPSDYATNATANGEAQMYVVVYGIEHTWDVLKTSTHPPGEWAPSYTATDTGITYNYTKDQFYALTDPEEACLSFLWQYERPSAPATAQRLRNARWVYDNMSNWGNVGTSHFFERLNEKQNFLLLQRRRKGYFI